MSELRIVTDSSMDMPVGWDKEYEISILPVNINFGEKTFRQGIDLSVEQFYRMVNDLKMIPHTSLPSPVQIMDFYRKIANKGDTILSLHVASKMSGTYNAVQLAAREIASEFNIFPFDSGNGSAGLAYMCKEARLCQRAGLSVQEIEATLNWFCLKSEHQKIYFLWRPCLPDPKDDHLLELAVASRTEFIITHNIKDFKGAEKFNVKPITPKEFLEKL